MVDSSTNTWADHLRLYRPVLDRAVFGVALLGFLVVVHLWIQQGRGFDRGCLGFSEPVPAATVDCNAVVQSSAGELAGVSNVLLGAFFYLGVAALSIGVAYAAGPLRRRLKLGRTGLVGMGFVYSLYLFYYQSAVVEQYCVLCLISGGIVLLLFTLHMIDLFTEPNSSMSNEKTTWPRAREAAVLSAAAVLVFILAGADVVYFNSLEEPQPAAAPADEPPVAQAEDHRQAPGQQSQTECRYDPEKGPFGDYTSLVQFTDPTKGTHDAPVTVIEYLDPNCPHCETLHPVMQRVIEEKKDQALFVYKLFPLRESSVPQILALRVAAQNNKFFEMLDAQFARNGILSVDQLRQIAGEIEMDPDRMVQRMRQQSLIDDVLRQRERAIELGITSTPTVIINGRVVASQSRTQSCLTQLIEEAASENG